MFTAFEALPAFDQARLGADAPTDQGKQMDPAALIFAHTPVEDPSVYVNVWKERSGTPTDGCGFYYQTISPVINKSGDTYELLDVLARDVGILGIFSDWPGTVTYYATCMGLK